MIGIIDIGLCNLRSVSKAVYNLGHDFVFVRQPADLAECSHCVLPGVGAFAVASALLEKTELMAAVQRFAATEKPVLGICLGMQLLATLGDEGGECQGLNLISGRIRRLSPRNNLRIPHVGWNTVTTQKSHPIFAGVKPQRDFYFVHSYHFAEVPDAAVLGTTDYGETFVSAVASKNVVGLQFHPEKSQANGLKLLENFCDWDGQC